MSNTQKCNKIMSPEPCLFKTPSARPKKAQSTSDGLSFIRDPNFPLDPDLIPSFTEHPTLRDPCPNPPPQTHQEEILQKLSKIEDALSPGSIEQIVADAVRKLAAQKPEGCFICGSSGNEQANITQETSSLLKSLISQSKHSESKILHSLNTLSLHLNHKPPHTEVHSPKTRPLESVHPFTQNPDSHNHEERRKDKRQSRERRERRRDRKRYDEIGDDWSRRRNKSRYSEVIKERSREEKETNEGESVWIPKRKRDEEDREHGRERKRRKRDSEKGYDYYKTTEEKYNR
ncbi:unnamed protein product [Moneuplotes crassus]|uniref:Uncharacterized protein n=1 Tax=Euplotes crassus TaxID=5936 RepID=A0AAD1XLN3_EUPCR|nr:unnamed protein product [Moneuplotes crassus]